MTIRPSRRDGDLERPVHLSDDELSAYINGEVTDPGARERFETHLESCAACRERLHGARVVVSLLNQAETPAPPRSFKLDPSMVRPVVVPAEPWIIRVQPAMRRLTAIAAVLLLVLVMADGLVNRSDGGATSTARDVTTSSQGASEAVAQNAVSTSGGNAGGEAPKATAAAAFSAPATSTSAAAAVVAQSSAESSATQPGTSAGSGAPVVIQPAPSQSSPSYWRLSEFAVVVVVIWLLFLSVALPRLQHRRQP